MNEKSLTYSQQICIMKYLGDLYRASVRRIERAAESRSTAVHSQMYNDDCQLKSYMERTLRDCSPNTQLITSHEFFENSPSDWYRVYYSQTTYYRLKKKAVGEFLHCLDI